jgi:hypothetical protein
MPKRVYHGTLSSDPPHEYGYPFHAGTLQAANDRIDDEISHGVYWEEKNPIITTHIHEYEIADDAPTSSKTWEDPMFYDNARKAVPEHSQSRIYPYINDREDRGSTSYVIPSRFVHEGQHVKHLRTEQFFANMSKDEENVAFNAMSTMVGGPRQPKTPR